MKRDWFQFILSAIWLIGLGIIYLTLNYILGNDDDIAFSNCSNIQIWIGFNFLPISILLVISWLVNTDTYKYSNSKKKSLFLLVIGYIIINYCLISYSSNQHHVKFIDTQQTMSLCDNNTLKGNNPLQILFYSSLVLIIYQVFIIKSINNIFIRTWLWSSSPNKWIKQFAIPPWVSGLVEILSEELFEEKEMIQIMKKAEMKYSNVSLGGSPRTNWFELIDKAIRQNRIQQLLHVLKIEAEDNQIIRLKKYLNQEI